MGSERPGGDHGGCDGLFWGIDESCNGPLWWGDLVVGCSVVVCGCWGRLASGFGVVGERGVWL
jgi:hypothetical protein